MSFHPSKYITTYAFELHTNTQIKREELTHKDYYTILAVVFAMALVFQAMPISPLGVIDS